ncbi:hypothetical protein SSX86_001429 [Deinandra increscens subsp. villosa]|uniref:WRKY domain-containing protein n=1 Tax=Deinandra increscens subsp. villosa TaxID=3103831 RepID=A0AAP0HCJ2_9ASTR
MNYHRLSKSTRLSLYPLPLSSTALRKDVDGACVYEEKTVIHELTQGIQMAKQLRANLRSTEARDFLIPKILTSYENALFVLKSGSSVGQSPAPAFSAASPPHDISIGSLRSEVYKFDQPFSIQQGQNVISKKRKGSPTWEKQSENGLEDDIDDGYNWRKYGQEDILAPPPPPTLPEKHEIIPTHQQLSPQNPGEMLSNLRANLSVDTAVLGSETIPSPVSFPSASSELMDDLLQFQFPDYNDDELWQDHSPPIFSPDSSETIFFTEWGSSSSLDFLAGPDIDDAFEFMNSFF